VGADSPKYDGGVMGLRYFNDKYDEIVKRKYVEYINDVRKDIVVSSNVVNRYVVKIKYIEYRKNVREYRDTLGDNRKIP